MIISLEMIISLVMIISLKSIISKIIAIRSIQSHGRRRSPRSGPCFFLWITPQAGWLVLTDYRPHAIHVLTCFISIINQRTTLILIHHMLFHCTTQDMNTESHVNSYFFVWPASCTDIFLSVTSNVHVASGEVVVWVAVLDDEVRDVVAVGVPLLEEVAPRDGIGVG